MRQASGSFPPSIRPCSRVQSDARLRPRQRHPARALRQRDGPHAPDPHADLGDRRPRPFQGSNLDPGGAKTGHVDLSEREHVRIHLWPDQVDEGMRRSVTQGLFIAKARAGKVSKKWTIQLPRPARRPGAHSGSVVVASPNPRLLEQQVASIDLGEGGIVALIGGTSPFAPGWPMANPTAWAST